MFKKTTLTSLAAFMLLGGLSANADQISEACKAKSNDFEKQLKCIAKDVKRKLRKSNPDGLSNVYFTIVPLAQNQTGPDFYNYVDTAFSKGMLELQAKMVSEKGLRHVSDSFAKTVDNSENIKKVQELLEKEAKENLQDEIDEREYQSLLDGIKKRIFITLGVEEDSTLSSEQKEKAKGIAKEAIFSSNFTNDISEYGAKAVQGLVTYATIIHTDKDSQSKLGIVAYQSDRSMQLYNAIANHVQITPPEDKSQCKAAEDILDELSDSEKLGKVGTIFYWNEKCQPALLSFATHSFSQANKALKDHLRSTAGEKVGLVARDNLAQFMGASVEVSKNFKREMSTVQNAMYQIMEDAIDNGDFNVQNVENNLSSKLTTVLKSHSKVSTKGMEEVDDWYDDLGDVGVVGVAYSYSLTNLKAVDKMESALLNAKQGTKNKPAASKKPAKSTSIYKSNSIVDDF